MKLRDQGAAKLLTTYLKPLRGSVILLAVLLFSTVGLQLLNPQLLRSFIDNAMAGASSSQLARIAAIFIGLAIGQQLLSVAATYFSEHVSWAATNALRADLALHCLELDLGFHKTRTPGEFIERIDGDVTVLANFFSQFVIQVLGNLMLLIGVLVALSLEALWIGLVLTAFVIVAVIGMAITRRYAVPLAKAARQAGAELYGFLEERLAATEDIRSSAAQEHVLRGLYAAMRGVLHQERRAAMRRVLVRTLPIGFFTLSTILTFLLVAYYTEQGTLSLGTAFLIFYYTELLFRPLTLLSNQIEDFQRASAGIERIGELLRIDSRVKDGPTTSLPQGAPAVEFDRVSFGYSGEDLVIKNLSFRLEPGRVLGLLGRTGSGKTTIARLIFRLYDPAAGTIRLGGVALPELHRSTLRGQIGLVTQDVQLFHATIRDNLTFFDPQIDDERILQVLKDVGLWSWYASLPDGLDTRLAPGSSGLSAGEAQLLAFTRVLLKDPALVILDEASSRLDPATEYLIERAIDKLLAGRTAIIIAHRLTTVQRADEVLILQDGIISEHGLRDQLVRDQSSYFYRLLQTQETLV